MSAPARPNQDDLPPPNADDPPGAIVWAIAGVALVLAYTVAVVLLRPTV